MTIWSKAIADGIQNVGIAIAVFKIVTFQLTILHHFETKVTVASVFATNKLCKKSDVTIFLTVSWHTPCVGHTKLESLTETSCRKHE